MSLSCLRELILSELDRDILAQLSKTLLGLILVVLLLPGLTLSITLLLPGLVLRLPGLRLLTKPSLFSVMDTVKLGLLPPLPQLWLAQVEV